MTPPQTTPLPGPATPEDQAGLDALLADPRHALIAADFDGTLAPIVDRPGDARARPGAVPALTALAGAVGTLAVITGRPAANAVDLGGFGAVPGLIVIGHYGWQRWQDDRRLDTARPPAGRRGRPRRAARRAAGEAGAPDGTWVEDKAHAVAVHTRRTADPEAALRGLRDPLGELAAGLGLAAEPGRFVIELRPPGVDKATALTGLAGERAARSVLFCQHTSGTCPPSPRCARCAPTESPAAPWPVPARVTPVAAEANLVVPGPDGIVALLAAIAGQLGPPAEARPAETLRRRPGGHRDRSDPAGLGGRTPGPPQRAFLIRTIRTSRPGVRISARRAGRPASARAGTPRRWWPARRSGGGVRRRAWRAPDAGPRPSH